MTIPLNTQKPAKLSFKSDGCLRVHSIFSTIQGEGLLAGTPALFIRLAGCNLQCPRCDTDYTSSQTDYRPQELYRTTLNAIAPSSRPPELLVVTGGEPFRQNPFPFLQLWQSNHPAGQILIETNGTLFTRQHLRGLQKLSPAPLVVCSPKLERVAPTLIPHISVYKYVLHHSALGNDGLPNSSLGLKIGKTLFRPSAEQRRLMRKQGRIMIQPEDSGSRVGNRKNIEACARSATAHRWRISLQLHKLLGLP